MKLAPYGRRDLIEMIYNFLIESVIIFPIYPYDNNNIRMKQIETGTGPDCNFEAVGTFYLNLSIISSKNTFLEILWEEIEPFNVMFWSKDTKMSTVEFVEIVTDLIKQIIKVDQEIKQNALTNIINRCKSIDDSVGLARLRILEHLRQIDTLYTKHCDPERLACKLVEIFSDKRGKDNSEPKIKLDLGVGAEERRTLH